MADFKNDSIYQLLIGARDKIVADFAETLKNASGVRFVYGEEIYNELVEKMRNENDTIVKELNARIERRITELTQ